MSDEMVRHKKRFNVALPVRMHSPFDSGGGSQRSRTLVEQSVTQNVSSGGCYFTLSREMPLGAVLDLELEIPGIEPIPRGLKVLCRARVVRVDPTPEPGKMGIACTIEEYRFSRTRKSRAAAA